MPSLKSLLALAAPLVSSVFASPVALERRASQSAPHFVAYWDCKRTSLVHGNVLAVC